MTLEEFDALPPHLRAATWAELQAAEADAAEKDLRVAQLIREREAALEVAAMAERLKREALEQLDRLEAR